MGLAGSADRTLLSPYVVCHIVVLAEQAACLERQMKKGINFVNDEGLYFYIECCKGDKI